MTIIDKFHFNRAIKCFHDVWTGPQRTFSLAAVVIARKALIKHLSSDHQQLRQLLSLWGASGADASQKSHSILTQILIITKCLVWKRRPPIKTSRTCTTSYVTSITQIELEACIKTNSRKSTMHTRFCLMKRKKSNMMRCEMCQNRKMTATPGKTSTGLTVARTIRTTTRARANTSKSSKRHTRSTPTIQVAGINLLTWTQRGSAAKPSAQREQPRTRLTSFMSKWGKNRPKASSNSKSGRKNSKSHNRRTLNRGMNSRRSLRRTQSQMEKDSRRISMSLSIVQRMRSDPQNLTHCSQSSRSPPITTPTNNTTKTWSSTFSLGRVAWSSCG